MRFVWALLALAAVSSAADIRTGVYNGRMVRFENVDGLAIFEGDIVLGNTADIEAPDAAGLSSLKARESSFVPSPARLWPSGRVPYIVDSTLSTALQGRINDAIAHWNNNTLIKFVARGANDANYVRFTTSTSTVACSSAVGMIGGAQLIRLPDGCGTGPIIHEMGHAVGFWHEQERADRNQYVTILYENIDKNYASNYDQVGLSGRDYGPYNFNSIMHYGPFDFSRDGLLPAMETVPAGIPIGQRTGLSPGDLDTVQRMYGPPPTRTTIATTPSGLKVLVDGVLVDDGTSFDWQPGSAHRIEAPFQGDPNTRFLFGSWSDGGTVAHTITASASTTVYIANFIRQRHLTFVSSPAGAGTIEAIPNPSDGFYADRSAVQLTARAASGFGFQTWNLTPSRSLNPKLYLVAAPTAVTATFAAGPITKVTSDPIGRTMIIDGGNYTTPVNFAWTPGTSRTLDVDTTQPAFIHYNFTGWDDGGAQSHSITAGADSKTYTAKFTTQYPLTLTSTSISATPSSSDNFYDVGTSLQIAARPPGTQVLLNWTGDLGGATNPATLVIDGQKLVGASYGSAMPAITAVSGATALTGAFAPGEIVVIYGSNLGPSQLTGLQVSGNKVTTSLGGTQVLFNGTAAPIVYTSANQVSAVVPYTMAGQNSVPLVVSYNGQRTAPVNVSITDTAPGLFTANLSGKGNAAVLNQNGSVNSAANPAHRGEIIVLYATGEGVTNPTGIDGQVAVAVYPKPQAPVAVRIGGQPAVVQYAGAAPGFIAGAMQINAQVPDGVLPGNVPVQIVVGNNASRSEVTIAVQ